ncbi:MAG: nucleoside hydrolase [Proteobacteria bacterium]|nr:nucleoside hydrolase [Pseudomonadota bacterium]MBI3496897.1 nucleoside hydrolase [Pseudomonadota bacterium]
MRLIIDTDTAGDDTFSLLLALKHPGVTLEAVTICNGNVDFQQQIDNALIAIEKAGRGGTVPVYPGCPRPMLRKWVPALFHGKDGMSDANFPKAAQRAETTHAVAAIIDRVMARPGEVSILAQAPLTNIAAAVVMEPRIAGAVRHLWIMGGTDSAIGNVTPTAEFNFYVDPEAAKIVLNAGFKMTISTWTLTLRSGAFDAEEIAEIEALDTPLSKFFMTVTREPRAQALARYGKPISTHPDSLTCACAIDERLILESDDCVVDVEVQGELTRGFSSIHPPRLGTRWPEKMPNARVIRRADTKAFLRMLKTALS